VPYQLAYMSTTEGIWSRADLLELLRRAREKNAKLDITGILLFRNAGFLQLLEGAREEVESLYGAICADVRHVDVTLIWETEGTSRWFADWSMGFRDLEEDPVTEPGLTDILRGPVEASAFSREVVTVLWSLLRRTEQQH
jgi:Sensors of blue-light using FAD